MLGKILMLKTTHNYILSKTIKIKQKYSNFIYTTKKTEHKFRFVLKPYIEH